MSELKGLLGQTAVYGLSSVFGRLLNYFLVPLYTRVFVPSEYGVITELYAYSTFLIILLTYGMETAFFRFASRENHPGKVYSTSLISIILTSGFFVLSGLFFADQVAGFLGYEAHPEYLIYFIGILSLDALCAIPFSRLRLEQRSLKFVSARMFNIGINIGFNLYFLVFCPYLYGNDPGSAWLIFYDPGIRTGYVFISNLLASTFTLIFLYKEFLIPYNFDKALWRRMILYSLPLLLGGMAGMANETLDRILLKFMLPFSREENLAQLGIYGACYKLSILMTLAIQAYRMAAEPFFFKIHSGKDPGLIYARAMNYFVLCCSLIFIGVMFHLGIIRHFIDEAYHGGLHIVPILLLANLFLGIFMNLSIWYKLADKTIYGTWFTLGGVLITITLNILWIPLYGYTGSAWATLICYFAMALACYLVGQRYYPVPYNIKKISLYLLSAIGLFLASMLLPGDLFSPGIRQIILSGTFFVYTACLWYLERRRKSVH